MTNRRANQESKKQVKADYGLDAPGVVRNLAIAGTLATLAGFVLNALLAVPAPLIGQILLAIGLLNGVSELGAAGLMLRSSKVGKLKMRDELIDALKLKGDEQVLDAGCGRGLLLIGAARRLTSGKATGLDIWQGVDQSGNSPDATLGNAATEGVSGKVEIRSGDMRLMPFEDQTFDVIVSSMAIHNIYDKAEREKALEEIVRVLKPGGQLAVIDFANTDEYAAYWKAHGIPDAQLSGARWTMFPPVRVVTGTKS